MDLSFAPIISLPIIICVFIIVLAILVFSIFKGKSGIHTARKKWSALRLLIYGALFLLFLNPELSFVSPSPEASRIIILEDLSPSMAQLDDQAQTRLERMKQDVRNYLSTVSTKDLEIETYAFHHEQLQAITESQNFDIQTGFTNISRAIQEGLQLNNELSLEGILLFTDGQHNNGATIQSLIHPLREKEVPVYSVVYGSEGMNIDYELQKIEGPSKTIKGESTNFKIKVRRNESQPAKTKLILSHTSFSQKVIELKFEENVMAKEFSFEYVFAQTGLQQLKVSLEAANNEINIINNQRYFNIEVENPQTFETLFYGNQTDWTYKFLHILNPQEQYFKFRGILQLGPNIWRFHNLPEAKQKPGFPGGELLDQMNVLIIDSNTLSTLTPEELLRLNSWVSTRGGGLIIYGPIEITELSDGVKKLLPYFYTQQNVTKTLNDSPLRIYENRFQQLANNELDLAFAKQLYLPKDTLLTLLKSADLKPSAQRLITDQSGEHLLYSSMNYGAGRISYLNFPSTWIWQMREHNGKNLFAKFWGTTISLMAVANRPRIELLPSSNQVISRENEIMKVKLLNADYQYQAAQSISIWLKDEIKKETIKLEALPSQTIGFYDIPIDNIPAGRYAIHIDAQMANHDKLRLKRYIDFTNENSEPIDTPANFGLMKLLSEQTGGQMFIESEIPKILEINWPKAYKQETKKFAFRESKVYYILLFMLLFLDWLIRRKTEW